MDQHEVIGVIFFGETVPLLLLKNMHQTGNHWILGLKGANPL
jgi:hypothetical protein